MANKKSNNSKNNKVKKNTSNKKIVDNKKKIENVSDGLDEDIVKKIYLVLAIVVFFCLFYILTIYITNKNSDDNSTNNDSETSEVSISYENIIAGRSFSMGEEEYLVLYYDKTDEELSSTVLDIIDSYSQKEDKLKMYIVDMHDALNSSYSSDESNTHPTNATEIKINGPTLIKFSNKEVSLYLEGTDNISDYLG